MLTDDERERLIEITGVMSTQGSPAVRRYWWDQMKAHINARSPEQVEKMERAKSLTCRPMSELAPETLERIIVESHS